MATFICENCNFMYKNFSGRPSDYNRDGERNVTLILPSEEMANMLTENGFNVKVRPPRDEYDTPLFTLALKVAFSQNPEESYKNPKIYIVHPGEEGVLLTAETVGSLDYARILNADVKIRGWNWSRSGRSGVAAYLDSAYVTLEPDPLFDKYGY